MTLGKDALRTLWVKERMFATSISPFPKIFCILSRTNLKIHAIIIVYPTHAKFLVDMSTTLLCVNPFPDKSWSLCVCSTILLKTMWEKEKLLVMSNFSFSHNVFYPFGEIFPIFIKFEIAVCKLFQFGSI